MEERPRQNGGARDPEGQGQEQQKPRSAHFPSESSSSLLEGSMGLRWREAWHSLEVGPSQSTLGGRRDGTGSRSPGPGLSVYLWCALGATGAHLRTKGFIPHVSPVSPARPPGRLHGSCECWPMCPTWNGLLGLHPCRAAGWGRGWLAKGSCHSCWGISSPAPC